MIFPFLNGILSFRLAPMTWAIFLLNLTVFAVSYSANEKAQYTLESAVEDEVFTTTQGFLYAQYVAENRQRYPASLLDMVNKTIRTNNDQRQRFLGSMAFRDPVFLREALDEPFQGDSVAINYWRKKFTNLMETQSQHPSYQMGVTSEEMGIQRLLSYQFTHSGFMHFSMNMIFFLIFAAVLEQVIGSFTLLMVYLFSGVFGAYLFNLLSEASAVPLIGASGAISGIIAMFAILFWNKNVRYLFFLLIFRRGFFGFIFLPAWLVLVLWLIQDLAGFLSTPAELGGVAYSAHLGGELCGAIVGGVLIAYRRLRGVPILPPELPVDTQPIFTKYT